MSVVRLPRQIKAFGQVWTVSMHAGLVIHPDKHHMEDEGYEVLGLTDSDQRAIVINSEQAKESMQETFLHECLHAMVASVALNRDLLADDEDEERMVKRLAPALLLFLRDNPGAVEFLVRR